MDTIRHERYTKAGLFFAIVCVLFSMGLFCTEKVSAGTFDNAYTFYSTYGNEMVFQNQNQGEIYYAIVGRESTASIKYKTIGWKVTVTNSSGAVIDTIYYDLYGDSMVMINESSADGYNYQLYKVSLENLKSRMSEAAREELSKANCNILFDSCTTVVIDGKVQGGMSDSGPAWGAVYMTYADLVNAQNWTDVSKVLLLSFYNKEVNGLFYSVTLHAGTGIASVSGAGRHCFGSQVTISAETQTGYKFQQWKQGDVWASNAQCYTITIGASDVSYTAYASPVRLKVNYYRGDETDGNPTETIYYTYGEPNQTLMDYAWMKTGYFQTGWSHTPNASYIDYYITVGVSNFWIAESMPEVNLYAVWEPNRYTIVYHNSGGEGEIDAVEVAYTDTLTLPVEGFTLNDSSSMRGWTLTKNGGQSDYALGENVAVSDIAAICRVETINGAQIPLYVVWDIGPIIYGNALYVSLKDAQNGVVDEEWFGHVVYARDQEDGTIAYGTHENNSLLMLNFEPTDYVYMQKGGYIMERFCAIDSSGNVTIKNIPVYIVEENVYESMKTSGRVRFISTKYYKNEQGDYCNEDAGGLTEDSIWRTNKTYRKLLDKLFS